MSHTIEKTFRFDAGHRSLGFNYKKRRNHPRPYLAAKTGP